MADKKTQTEAKTAAAKVDVLQTNVSPLPNSRELPAIPALPTIDDVKDPVSPLNEFFGVYMSAMSGVPGARAKVIDIINEQTMKLRDRQERAKLARVNLKMEERQQALNERSQLRGLESAEGIAALNRQSNEKIAGIREAGEISRAGRTTSDKAAELEMRADSQMQAAQKGLTEALDKLATDYPDIPVNFDIPQAAETELLGIINSNLPPDEKQKKQTEFMTRMLRSRMDAIANVSPARKEQFIGQANSIIESWARTVSNTPGNPTRAGNFLVGNLRSYGTPIDKVIARQPLGPADAQAFMGMMTERVFNSYMDDKQLSERDAIALNYFWEDYNQDPHFLDYLDIAFTRAADRIAEARGESRELIREQMNQYLTDAIQMGEARISLPAAFAAEPLPGQLITSPTAAILGNLTGTFGPLRDEQGNIVSNPTAEQEARLRPLQINRESKNIQTFGQQAKAQLKELGARTTAVVQGRAPLVPAIRELNQWMKTTLGLDPSPDKLQARSEMLNDVGAAFEDDFTLPRSKEGQAKELLKLTDRLRSQVDAGRTPTKALVRRVLKLHARVNGQPDPTDQEIQRAVNRWGTLADQTGGNP